VREQCGVLFLMRIAISVLRKCVSIVATKNSNALQLREHCEVFRVNVLVK
jgi:hypothetical protein